MENAITDQFWEAYAAGVEPDSDEIIIEEYFVLLCECFGAEDIVELEHCELNAVALERWKTFLKNRGARN